MNARRQGNFVLVNRAEVDYIDVSPKQLVSVAASLVPFLEHDDANRALMGANMQRQSCSAAGGRGSAGGHGHGRRDGARLRRRDPGQAQRHCGFGRLRAHHRARRGRASSHAAFARGGFGHLQLIKFKRSNQNTCINQKPVVREGDRVVKGQVIADGPCTEQGELALGRNVLVAFMPWRGYNFEDAILISEKLVREDYYTSVHIEEFEIEARDTKLGPEEITRDIPNVSEHALRDLDESGVIRIGAQIGHGDILVGKVTPKGETQLTPEEKLLRAIFGEKAGDVRDASLTCPPGIEGTVVDVRIFSRKGQEKDERAKLIEAEYVAKLEKNLGDEIRILTDERLKRLEAILGGKEVLADLHDERTNKRLLTKGAILDRDTIERISTKNLKRIRYDDKDPRVNEQIDEIEEMTSRQIEVLRKITNEKVAKLQKGDELPPGVIKLVKVYVAMKRKLSGGRQDGRPPRQQGRDRAHSSRGRHAVSARWNAGGDCAESAGRAFAYERGPDSGDAPGLGRACAGQEDCRAGQGQHRCRVYARTDEEGVRRNRDAAPVAGARRRDAAARGGRHGEAASGSERRCSTARRRARSRRCWLRPACLPRARRRSSTA